MIAILFEKKMHQHLKELILDVLGNNINRLLGINNILSTSIITMIYY